MTATARQAAPLTSADTITLTIPGQRTAPAPIQPQRPTHLQALPPVKPRAARGPFVAFIAAILGLGLLALLGLNTVLAQGSFAAFDLRQSTTALADREQALLQEVAIKESPQHLQREADRLGMVPSENPVFLRLADGKVLGVPEAAKAPKPAATKKTTSATSTATTTATTKPTAQKPAAQKPAAQKPAPKKPAARKPTTQQPATTTGSPR
jgi:hypothetical protein